MWTFLGSSHLYCIELPCVLGIVDLQQWCWHHRKKPVVVTDSDPRTDETGGIHFPHVVQTGHLWMLPSCSESKVDATKTNPWKQLLNKYTCFTQGGSGTTSLAWKYIKVCGYSDYFCKNLNQRSLTPRWPLTPHLLRSYVWHDSTQGSLCPSPMKIHQSMWIQWPFLQTNLKQRSLTPRWPLTPHLLRPHVWLYPRIIVSKSHENTSKYVDTVTLFAKTWTKGHWPLDDLWSHIWWGYMCDSTQGSLFPSPMGIHQVCGYSDQSCKSPHTSHTYTYYVLRTESVITVSFWITFRRDKDVLYPIQYLPRIPGAQ